MRFTSSIVSVAMLMAFSSSIDDYGSESMAAPVFDTKGIMLSAGLALFGGLILILTIPTSLTPVPSVGSVFSPPSRISRWEI
jgi:hypothetical protein